MQSWTWYFLAGVLLLALPAAALSADKHPYTVNDQVLLQRISDPRPAPDGKSVAFVLRSTDFEANRGHFEIWLAAADGSGARQLTRSSANSTNPRWSADGKSLYFLSGRSGSDQIWRLPLEGGEPQQITDLPLDVANMSLSPDGKWFLFSLEVFPGTSPKETAKRLEERGKSKVSGRVYEQLLYRHWDSWSDGRRNHLFSLPAAGGEPRDVMAALEADAPSRPMGGTEEFTFTPDGKGVVFACRDVGREEAWSTNLDLFYAPLDGSSAARRLTGGNKATDTQPTFSPDGKTLAYLAMSRAGYEADRFRIMLREGIDGGERELAPKWDRSPSSIDWSRDGKTLYAVADDLGQTLLFALDIATGTSRKLTTEGHIDGLAVMKDGTLLFGLDHLRLPTELHTIKPDGSGFRAITAVNAAALDTIAWGEPEQFSFKGWNNETVYAWVVKPVGFMAGKKYPVAFLIHGGPQGSFSNHFHYRWNPQVYAGRGYAAVMVDFHGSTGYGQAFTDAIRGDWGGKPLEDLKRGLDAALAKYPWMDGNRVAALGASYGGYMINWIAGNWSDRFRCLVNHDGVFDTRMGYYDTEEIWFDEWERLGTPWEKPLEFEKHNPARFVDKWKTPMLVIHGGKDYRVVETNGMAAFTALQRRGIPSKFLHFPDENHWVLKPQNSVFWHETVLAWLDRWTK